MAFKIPKLFAAGTKAKADDVNENFAAIENEINSQLAPGLYESGDLKLTARADPPEGWLVCDGSAVSRTTYSALFQAIGTTFGTGDGATTFNLPDYRGRTPVGVDGAAGRLEANDTLGKAGGHNRMASHNHGVGSLQTTGVPNHQHIIGQVVSAGVAAGSNLVLPWLIDGFSKGSSFAGEHGHSIVGSTGSTGAGPGGADDRMPPYQVCNVLVKI